MTGRDFGVRATPFSNNPYHPLFLANGKDCVVVDYSSSNYVSMNGHSHFERHQGSPCGWYKALCRTREQILQPLFATGVQVYLNGAAAEPSFYEQRFDPFTATVSSILTFEKDIKILVEGFLSDESLWCERVEVLEYGNNKDLKIGYYVQAPISFIQALRLPENNSFCGKASENAIDFDYTCKEFSGKGFVIPDRPFDELQSGIWSGKIGYFANVSKGFCTVRYIACCDSSENELYERLRERAQKNDYRKIRDEHLSVWERYFSTSSITLPEKTLEYEYYLSRYILRATQHPETGLITCGFFPNHWGGDVCCSYDSDFSQKALSSSGNIDEAVRYVYSYEYVAPQGYKILSVHGLSGTTFLGWVNCLGEYINNVDPFTSIVSTKPIYGAYVFVAIYDLWKKDKSLLSDSLLQIARDALGFMERHMLREENGKLYLVPVKAGTEAGFVVKVDTFTQLLYSMCFKYCSEIFGDSRLKTVSDRLFEALECNYDEDGALLPFENAGYYGGLQFSYYLWTYPDPIDFISVEKAIESSKTHWGYSFDQTTESYRHWPWIHSMAALCCMRDGKNDEAMSHITKICDGMCAIGGLPEKIRIDGAPINYWYTSTHALAVWAINDAFAFTGKKNEIVIAGGYTREYGDISCRDISVDGMLFVSYDITGGVLRYFEIKNRSENDVTVRIKFNPEYEIGNCESTFAVKSKDSCIYRSFGV